MKYRIKLWCRDCVNEDPAGCFNGETEIQEEQFDNVEDAEKFGDDLTDSDGLLEFTIINELEQDIRPEVGTLLIGWKSWQYEKYLKWLQKEANGGDRNDPNP
jgi:hypothetical protein